MNTHTHTPVQIGKPPIDGLDVLLAELVGDDFDVGHGIDTVLDVHDIRILKGTHHVHNTINSPDVGQERVAQALHTHTHTSIHMLHKEYNT